MPADKVAHFCLGLLTAGGVMTLLGPVWAAVAVIVAALGKEAWDWRKHGKPDAWDAVATIAGGAFIVGAALWLN